MKVTQKITPFLWFDGIAEDAANYYVALFEDSKILDVNRQGPGGPVFSVGFQLAGQPFIALNGGPHYKLTEAFSLFVSCESQAEIDALWEKLSAGGQEQQCGWLKDKFGLSWQIVPSALGKLLSDPDPAKAGRVMQAMMKMVKLDVAELERAAEG